MNSILNPGVLRQLIEDTGVKSKPGEIQTNSGVGFGLPDPENYLAAQGVDERAPTLFGRGAQSVGGRPQLPREIFEDRRMTDEELLAPEFRTQRLWGAGLPGRDDLGLGESFGWGGGMWTRRGPGSSRPGSDIGDGELSPGSAEFI